MRTVKGKYLFPYKYDITRVNLIWVNILKLKE